MTSDIRSSFFLSLHLTILMNRPVVVENRKRKATASQDDPELALVKVSTDFVWATDKTSVNAAAILFWRRALHHDCVDSLEPAF